MKVSFSPRWTKRPSEFQEHAPFLCLQQENGQERASCIVPQGPADDRGDLSRLTRALPLAGVRPGRVGELPQASGSEQRFAKVDRNGLR
jgi:hypothetical protein